VASTSSLKLDAQEDIARDYCIATEIFDIDQA
jgi:hypothetical protein